MARRQRTLRGATPASTVSVPSSLATESEPEDNDPEPAVILSPIRTRRRKVVNISAKCDADVLDLSDTEIIG
jgi:hypothetical protein